MASSEEFKRSLLSGTLDESGPKMANAAAGAHYLNRIAALVALCEEVITDLSQTEDEWRPEMRQALVDYRERLAQLKGQR